MSSSSSTCDIIKLLTKIKNIYGPDISAGRLLDIVNDKSNYIDIYADGASYFDGSTRITSIGVFFGDDDVRNISKIIVAGNNNEAEIIACIEALKVVINKYYFVCIYTDSRLVVDGMNKDCSVSKFEKLFGEIFRLAESFILIKWVSVKGHSGIYGNEQADKLAKIFL